VVQVIIPGNDDAIRSCRLIVSTIGEAISEGLQLLSERELREQEEQARREKEEAHAKAAAEAAAPEPEPVAASAARAEQS